MPIPRAGRSASLSSVTLHLLVIVATSVFVCYYVSILGLIFRKGLGFTYSTDDLVDAVCLLFLLIGLEVLIVLPGVWDYLMENEGFVLINLFVTGTSILLTLSFLKWQTRLEVDSMLVNMILNSVLLVFCGFDGVLICSNLAQLASDE